MQGLMKQIEMDFEKARCDMVMETELTGHHRSFSVVHLTRLSRLG